MAELQIKIDPGPAAQGARTIRKEIEWVQTSAEKMEKAVDKAAASAGKLGTGPAVNGARVIKRSVDDIAKASDNAGRAVGGFTGAANDNFKRLNAQVAGVAGTFRTLMAVLGPLAALFSIRALQQYADGWSDMQSRVGAAIKDMEAAPRLMKRIVDIANASYSPLSQTVEIFGRNVAVLRDLGKTANQAADFTEALNHAMVITATKGQDAEVVQNALSRAIATGGLRAMEYETIMSRSPRVLEAIAKEAGTTLTGLRALATQGKVTGQVIADGLIKSLAELREEAGEMPATIGDAFVRIGTNLTAFIGQMDKAAGSSSAIAAALILVADNLDRVITYAATAATAFGTYYVAAFVYANVATLTLAGSLAFLRAALIRTGIGIAVVAAGELVYQFTRLVEAAGSFGEAMALLKDVGAEVWERMKLDAVSLVFGLQAVWGRIKTGFLVMLATMQKAWGDFLHLIADTASHIPGMGAVADGARDAAIAAITGYNEIEASVKAAREEADRLAKASDDAAKASRAPLESLKKLFEVLNKTDAASDAGEGAEKLAGATEVATKAYTNLIAKARERIEQMKLELSLVGKAGAETEALRFEQDLLSQVMVQSGTVTASQRREIHALAQEYGALAQAMDEARLANDLAFERAQLGRTDVEKRVASEMRGIFGDDYLSHMNDANAGQIRFNEELAKTGELGKEAFDGIIDALTSGGDLVDNLISALAQLGKEFAKIGQQKLFDYISGKSPSLFGNVQSSPTVGGGVSVANVGREAGRAMAQPISDRFASVGEDLASNIHAAASTLGISARDLATVISYETGGTFSTSIRGGAGNNHIGLIQFGPEEQRKYGAAVGQALSDQMQAVVGYLKDRGLKPGMDLLDIYSTINAGRPGLYNRSDAANGGAPGTVYDKVTGQMAGHQATADRILGKQAVSDGMMDYTRRVSSSGTDSWEGLRQTSVAGMSKTQGLLGVGGAAIGAFAGGYESGSPLGGALNGAMAGAGAAPALAALGIAGPVGIIGGAILGFIGGLLGKAKQKREELKKAQQELENQIGAITNLMRTATGNYLGAMEKQFGDTVDEFQKAIALAEKAKNSKLATQLKDSMNEFFTKLINDWNAGFEGTLASLNAGLGMDGEFLKGMDAVDKMRESLIGFVNDAKFFAEANGDLSKMLDARKKELGIGQKGKELFKPKDDFTIYESGRQNPGTEIKNDFVEGYKDLGLQLIEKGFQAFTEQGAQLYTSLTDLTEAAIKAGFAIDEQGKVTRVVNEAAADTVARAMEAARKTALASLSGGKTFSEIEQAIQRLEGAAASLPDLLEDLGMSAEEAADAIEHHLNYALDNLRKNYIDGLNASINDLSDFGFLNELIAAQDKYRDRLIDTAALGLDGSLALKEFNLSLAKTIKGADLTEKQIDMLAAAFPAIAGIIDTLAGPDVIQQVEDAKSALQAAYDKEKSAIEQTISRLESFTKAIKTFRDEMRLNSSTPLGQKDQVDEAAKQFRDIAQKAMGGDEDAMDKLTGVSQNYLDEAREYYASSEDYFKIWNEVDKTLSNVEDKTGLQLTQAQKQLAALDKQVAGLININDSVLTVAQAIANLNAALGARDTALQDQIKAAQNAGQTADPFITSLYKSVLNRTPDAEGAAYYTAFLKAGMSHEDLRAKFIANAQPEIDRGYPKFAAGGFHSGGMAIVGENGRELVNMGPSRIWNASDTQRMLRQSMAPASPIAPSNDNSGAELVKEVRALREQVARLEKGQSQNTQAVAASGAAITGAVHEGNAINRDTGTAVKRAISRP